MHPYRLELFVGALPVLILLVVAGIAGLHAALRRDSDPGFYRWVGVVGGFAAMAAVFVEAYRTRFLTGGVFLISGGGLQTAPGEFVVDRYSLFAAVILCAIVIVVAVLSGPLTVRIAPRSGAFHALLLTAAAGGILVVDSVEMVSLIAGVTLVVVSLVGLAALVKIDAADARAAHRSAVMLGVALLLIVYGCSLIYGVTGSTDLLTLRLRFGSAPLLGITGAGCVLLGFLGLGGLMPLQRWIADVAEVAPGPLVAAVLTLATAASVLGGIRFVSEVLGPSVAWWPGLLAAMALVTGAYSAFLAFRDNRVRRQIVHVMLGQAALMWLTIAAVGPGLLGSTSAAAAAALFQLVVLLIEMVAIFTVLGTAEASGLGRDVGAYRGLTHRIGPLGGFFAFALLGLTALPPMGLFLGQLLGLTSVVSVGLVWAAVLALIVAGLLAVPPLRLAALSLGEPPVGATPLILLLPRYGRLTVAACCAGALLATVLAEPILFLATSAAGVLPAH